MTAPDLWAYLVEDDDGDVGVAYAETAGGRRTPLLATTRGGARSLRPIAERLSQMLDRPLTLVHYAPTGTAQEVLDAIDA